MYDPELLKSHCELIKLLNSTTKYIPKSLTWQGHEFLDASRNETVWKKTLKTINKKRDGLTFEVIKALLTQYTKEEFNLLTH